MPDYCKNCGKPMKDCDMSCYYEDKDEPSTEQGTPPENEDVQAS